MENFLLVTFGIVLGFAVLWVLAYIWLVLNPPLR